MTCEPSCEPTLQIVAGNTLTPLSFVLLQSGQPIDLAGSTIEARLEDEDGAEALAPTDTGITIQPQRYVGSIDAAGSIRINGHNLQNGYQVRFTTSGGLPAGLSAGTPYFVRDCTPNEFKVSARPSSAAIKPTGGTGTHAITPLGVVYWELPDTVTAGNYRVWITRTEDDKTDDFGHPKGIALTVR